jgi:1-acyl-sn-glycerol-3-phosphate acyltransferase
MMWFHRLADFLLRIVLSILLRLDIAGLENTPPEGPLIVAVNHTSFLDPLLGMVFIPRTVFPLGKIELFEKRFVGWIFPAYGVIPIRRGTIDREAITRSLRLLRNGGVLLVAPEGTRSDDGRLQQGRNGSAVLAARTDASILPVAIWGVMDFEANIRRLRRTHAHMTVGPAFKIKDGNRRIPRDQLDTVTDEIMFRIAALLPVEHRGVYADLDRASSHYLEPVRGQPADALDRDATGTG